VLQSGQPAHPMPGLGAYLLLQVRHNFYILLIIAFKGLIDRLAMEGPWTKAHPTATVVALGAVVVVLFAITPWIIVRLWRTVRLPDPPAGRLYAVARKYRIGFTQILLWHTHHMMPNAAILGPVPLVRYFLLTDALLESLTDRQIEAVFAHEIGHGYHKHMWWYSAFLVAVVAGSSGMADVLGLVIPALHAPAAGGATLANQIVSLGLLAAGMGWGFSCLSHRFEHQADWFAARHMAESLAAEPEMLADPAVVAAYVAPISSGVAAVRGDGRMPPPVPGESLAKGVEIFSSSLRQLVEMTHRSLNKRGWLHPSVQQRVALLEKLAAAPEAAAAFERMQRRVRWVIVAVVVVGLGLAVWAELAGT